MGIKTPVWIQFLLIATGRVGTATPELREWGNGYLAVRAKDGCVESLRSDPSGKGRYEPNFLRRMAFEGIVAGTPEATMETIGDGAGCIWRGLTACRLSSVSITQCDRPDLLQPDHTLGQSFSVPGTFDRVTVKLPTWHTSDACATLELLQESRVIASRRLESIVDNSLETLTFDPQPPGAYVVRLSEPKGTVGWWSSGVRRYEAGSALVDGAPDQNSERFLEVPYRQPYGEAEVRIALDDARLDYDLTILVRDPNSRSAHPLLWSVPWERDGYDTSARATPFKRFYTDAQRFMPIEQLKRTEDPGLTLHGTKWLHIDGTGNSDYQLRCPSLAVSWRSSADEMSIRITMAADTDPHIPQRSRQKISLDLMPRADAFPPEWPAFETSDPELNRDLNLMLYERNFTYPAPCGPAPWVEWSAIARGWFGGPLRDGERNGVAGLVMDASGYLHTWAGEPGWPFPDPKVYDTRHFDTNARYILAAWRHVLWTHDTGFLRGQAVRLRRAMAYQLEVLRGEEGLTVTASKDITGRHRGIGNNYWDILPFGHLDAYSNIVFYASLEAMAEIEEILALIGEPPDESSSKARGTTPDFYRQLRERCRQAYVDTFWDDGKGRFIGCVDADGERHDYGFVFLNLEAMAYGLASAEQAERIYDWLEYGLTSTGKADIYTQWVFAPRATTIHNPVWNQEHPDGIEGGEVKPWWHFGWTGTPFGEQCQDGGAILYTSFFDLMARTKLLGPDNAYGRWKEILDRYREPDRLCGGKPLFRGETPQQVLPGAVGVDLPFPESGLVPCWFLYGVMGVEPTVRGLKIAPRLPEGLEFCAAHNVSYRGLPLSIRATRREVRLACSREGVAFEEVYPLGQNGEVVFSHPPGKPDEFPVFGPLSGD